MFPLIKKTLILPLTISSILLPWSCHGDLARTSSTFSHEVTPSCSVDARECEFHFRVSYNWTMMKFLESGRMMPVFQDDNGTFWFRRKDCSGQDLLQDHGVESLLLGDGSHKMVTVINGQLPGPPIVVYTGQQVVVTLKNDLVNEVVTLHWHGLEQRGTPWMDGVGSVSQCPIAPGQSFTYRFIASPSGSHWYHSHLGTQRSEGVYGPLIVLPHPGHAPAQTMQPDFAGDFMLMVQDWMHKASHDIYDRLKYDLFKFPEEFDRGECRGLSTQTDGLQVDITPFVSALFNGKGRQYDRNTNTAINPLLPLETFHVQKDSLYLFRLASASMTYSFRISIDHHPLHVVSTDGSDVIETVVESIVIHGGERYDFWINATDPTDEGIYWIRAENLEYVLNKERITPGHTEAVLKYTSSVEKEPASERNPCTLDSTCLVLNCPFKSFPKEYNMTCLPLTQLQSLSTESPTLTSDLDPDLFTEHFLNFHFSGDRSFGAFKPNINGIVHVQHTVPPQVYPLANSGQNCSGDCVEDACFCTHKLALPLGHTIQLVLMTFLPPLDEDGITGTSHPIHLHGHHAEVIKIGYPVYNSSGRFLKNNPDLICSKGSKTCNRPEWRNTSWTGGNLPGIVKNALRKDTIMVPGGGYVVLRFKADNPGFWYLHCHVEYHNEIGMALVMQEGDIRDMNAAPPTFRTCGDFHWTHEQFLEAVNNPQAPGSVVSVVLPCGDLLQGFKLATRVLGCLTVLLILTASGLLYRLRIHHGGIPLQVSPRRSSGKNDHTERASDIRGLLADVPQ